MRLPQLRDGDFLDELDSWAGYAMALLYGFGTILAAVSCLLPGRAHPEIAAVVAGVGFVTAVALFLLGRRPTLRVLGLVLALGSGLVSILVVTSGRFDSGDAGLYAFVGLFAGFFLGPGWLAVHMAIIAAVYGGALVALPDDAAAVQQVVLVVGASTGVGLWSLAVRRVVDALLARQRQLARTDVLTGLANRAELMRLAQLRLQAPRGADVAVLVIDLDGFKRVNDLYGHATGDLVLRTVAERLRALVRADDVVARLGGDEFAILAVDHAGTAVEAIARRADVVLREPIETPHGPVRVGASVGLATWQRAALDLDALMHDADAAMYAVKRAGGGWRRAGDVPDVAGPPEPARPA